MKKNGFTLIELLCVVVVLSITFLFISPKIVQLVKEGKETNVLITDVIVIDKINEYVNDNNLFEKFKVVGDTYSIEVNTLIDEGYIENEVPKDKTIIIKLEDNDKLSYTIS